MVELRKRKEAPSAPAPAPAAKKERQTKATKAANGKASAPEAPPPVVTSEASKPATKPATKPKASAKAGSAKVDDTIDLDGFGGEVENHEGETVTLKALVEASKAGVVLFTYPKASTPGCTTQACLFRDSFDPLTATGLDIFGLSRDSPKSNTNFKTKQNLPYPLLCDKAATLIGAIGLKNGDKTQRGVFVVSKDGKVLAAEPGGPAATVEVVRELVKKMGGTDANGEKKLDQAEETAAAEEKDGNDDSIDAKEKAAVAGEVADTAEKLGDKGY